MPFNWKEAIDSFSPQSAAGFSQDGGSATARLLLDESPDDPLASPTGEDLQNAVTDLIGDVGPLDPSTGDGRLQRTPPKAHPIFPWLSADSITDIRGVGKYEMVDAVEGDFEVPPLPQWAQYDQYWYTVKFSPRPYPIVQDSSIFLNSSSWFDDSGVPISFEYATESERYCWTQIAPQFDVITAQQGQMIFRSSNPPPDGPEGLPYTGMPRMFLPNSVLKVYWQWVPLRYITSENSYIAGGRGRWPFAGRINQNDVTIAGTTYSRGALMYLSYNYTPFTPPVQKTSTFAPGVFAMDKLCNIELNFLLTNRTADDIAVTPTNKNFITFGHNLQPWFTDRKFHYTESVAPAGGDIDPAPEFRSMPTEILFSDPDCGLL